MSNPEAPWESARRLLSVVILIVVVGLPIMSRAQVARMEVTPFPSVTLTDPEFLVGREEGKPAMVAGELRLPRPGTDRLPLVILLHGSGGASGAVVDWEPVFLEMGVATFVIDSFTGRGIASLKSYAMASQAKQAGEEVLLVLSQSH
jgi:hypothetical protein